MVRRLLPDTRLDWRNPDMPVLRDYVFSDGHEIHGPVTPAYERQFRRYLMTKAPVILAPHWRKDPSYNWNRKPRKRVR